MNNKNEISGIFSDTLKNCAHWFLYVFIHPSATMTTAIRQKRDRQIYWLNKLDRFNTYYNYNQLLAIISEGIIQQFGKRPDQVLQLMYDTITTNAIGLVNAIPEDSPDALDNTTKAVDNLNALTIVDTKTGTSKNVWTDIASVVEWLVKIFQSLNIVSSDKDIAKSTPDPSDFYAYRDKSLSESSMATALPYVVGGVIIYYLFTKSKSS